MALRVKNISEGYVDGKGVFHPIRAAADYKPKRASEKKKYATGKKAKPSKAKKTVTVAHVKAKAKKTLAQIKAMLKPKTRKVATKKANPLPVGKYIKAKVKRCADGTVKVMITR